MKKILSLDLGTNSIGWSFISYDSEQEQGTIHGIGSRIVPMDVNFLKEFNEGKPLTKNVERRTKRGTRRLIQRYKLRRERLLQVLGLIIPEAQSFKIGETRFIYEPATLAEFQKDWGNRQFTDDTLVYFLRKKAVTNKIELSELFRILYHLNQRRGFKSGRLEKNKEKESKNALKSDIVTKTIFINSAIDSGEKTKSDYSKWLINYDDDQKAISYSKALASFVGKEVIVNINQKKEDNQISLPKSEETWTVRRDDLEKKINESSLTVGTFYYQNLKTGVTKNKHYRIKDNIVQRSRYIDEFNAIWQEQCKHHTILRGTETLIKQIANELYPNNEGLRNDVLKSNLGDIIKEHIIYFQRPLKSQKNNIAECRFEKRHKVTPRSSPIYEEFRTWKQINNIKLYDAQERFKSFLTPTQKEVLYTLFDTNREIDADKIIKTLKLDKKDTIIKYGKTAKLKGNNTRCLLRGILKKYYSDKIKPEEVEKDCEAFLNDKEAVFYIWHLLYSVDDETYVANGLRKKFPDFSPALVDALCDLSFEKQYGSLSSRACEQILSLMRVGSYFNENNIKQKTRDRIQRFLDAEESELDKNVEESVKSSVSLRSVLADCQGLMEWEATSIIYGSHSAKPVELYNTPEDIKPFVRHSLRNPIVEQIANEALSIVRAIWQKWEIRPDEIRIEFSRELRMSAAERASKTTMISKNEAENKMIKDALAEIPNANPNAPSHILKYKLWLEAGKTSPYTGKSIPIHLLFTEAYQIEHIVAKTRYYDNSRKNVTVCESGVNDEKGNKLLYDYLKEGSTKFDDVMDLTAFENHVRSTFSAKKANWFLQDKIPIGFIESQMKLTEYISVAVAEELRKVAPVQTSTGLITDMLKEQWGLTKLFKEELTARYEYIERESSKKLVFRTKDKNGHDRLDIENWDKRIDHRHHALDALAIACTTLKHVKHLNDINQMFENLQQKKERKEIMQEDIKSLRKFNLPWSGFVKEAKEHLISLIVSVKNRKRLISQGQNAYQTIKNGKRIVKQQSKKNGIQTTNIVRGGIHTPNPIGEIRRFEKISVETFFKKYDRYKKILAHDWQIDILQKRLEENHSDPKLALQSLKNQDFRHPNGKILRGDWISVSVPKYVFRRPLTAKTPFSQLLSVADEGLKKELLDHLVEFGQLPINKISDNKVKNGDSVVLKSIELAFGSEGLEALDIKRLNKTTPARKHKNKPQPPIRSIRTIEDGDNWVGESVGKAELRPKTHVEKGGNFCVMYNLNLKTNKREIETLAFYDAVQNKVNGISNTVEKVDCKPLFTLTHHDLVYVPYDNEEISSIDWTNKKQLFHRIYSVVKFSGSEVYFKPHFVSKELIVIADDKKVGEFIGGQGGITKLNGDKISINQKCIKIVMDKLGQTIKPILHF